MGDIDPRTKAELLMDLAATENSLEAIREDRDKWRQAKQSDKEAEAINACVRALDVLRDGNGPVTFRLSHQAGDMRRVLRYLADRYGVTYPPASAPGRCCENGYFGDGHYCMKQQGPTEPGLRHA